MAEFNIDEEDYENALKFSDEKGLRLHLVCSSDSCIDSNYFYMGLRALEANIDIQPVMNYYKTVTNMCSYLSKDEYECS